MNAFKTWVVGLLMLGLLMLGPLVAVAHKPSDSYLHLRVAGAVVTGQWDMALRDLHYALNIDVDRDGVITWGELRANHARIAEYALGALRIRAADRACPATPVAHLVDTHSDGAYSVLRFTARCPDERDMALTYDLLFDLDPTHRGLLNITGAGATRTLVLSPQQRRASLASRAGDLPGRFAGFVREGIWHIWMGFDHVLFLLTLLLPAALQRYQRAATGARGPERELGHLVKVITAFTLAHSITLAVAVAGLVTLPARWVESAIAISVVLAALNNLYPVVTRRLWIMAFGFGLIHGFGFAAVLQALGLDGGSVLAPLLGFNLGVEIGQLGIVAAVLPAVRVLAGRRWWPRPTLRAASIMVAVVAAVWFVERAFDLSLV